jgi:hypothetical protein
VGLKKIVEQFHVQFVIFDNEDFFWHRPSLTTIPGSLPHRNPAFWITGAPPSRGWIRIRLPPFPSPGKRRNPRLQSG